FRKKFRWVFLLFIWSFWIAYSRVYLGVHFPGDVVVGGAIGVFWGWICYLVARRTKSLELSGQGDK
ncbi:MAG: phosphatase PAP2 family protein, partial [Cytophagales bacterium]|nr:phosphatase PAP2 family protein [Cytophagales bacterium]